MQRGIKVKFVSNLNQKVALLTLLSSFAISSILTGCSYQPKDIKTSKIERDIEKKADEKDFGFIINGDIFVKFCIVPSKNGSSKKLYDLTSKKIIGVLNDEDSCVYSENGAILYCSQQIYFFDDVSESTKWDLDSVKGITGVDVLKEVVYKDIAFDEYSVFKKTNINTAEYGYFVGQEVCENVFYDYGANETFLNDSLIIEELLHEVDKVNREDLIVIASRLSNVDVESIVKTYKNVQGTNFKEYLALNLNDYENSIERIVNSHKDEGAGKRISTLTEDEFSKMVSYDNHNEKLVVSCKDVYSIPETFYTKLNNKILSDNIKTLEIKDNHIGSEDFVLDCTKIDFSGIDELFFVDCPVDSLEGIRTLEVGTFSYCDRNDVEEKEKIKFSPCNASKVVFSGANDYAKSLSVYINSKTEEVSVSYMTDNCHEVRIINTETEQKPLTVLISLNRIDQNTIIELPKNVDSLSLSVSEIKSANLLRDFGNVKDIFIHLKDSDEVMHSSDYTSLEEFVIAVEVLNGIGPQQPDEAAMALTLEYEEADY